MADKLFLLRAGFTDPALGDGVFYCPYCAAITGLLEYYPQLRSELEVIEVDFPRPRPAVAQWLGDDHPGCPLLVLDAASAAPAGIEVQLAPTGLRYIVDSIRIGQYLAAVHGVAAPHP